MKKLLFSILAIASFQANASIDFDLATSCNWKLQKTDGSVVANSIRLHPSGKVTAFDSQNEYKWEVVAGNVALLNKEGFITTHFNEMSLNATGQVVLKGRSMVVRNTDYTLTCRI
jgi:hypothetical protein